MREEQSRYLVMRHTVSVVADDDLLGSAQVADRHRCLDVHRLGVESVPDQLPEDVHRACAFHVPQDGVAARAYLLGLHRPSLRSGEGRSTLLTRASAQVLADFPVRDNAACQ